MKIKKIVLLVMPLAILSIIISLVKQTDNRKENREIVSPFPNQVFLQAEDCAALIARHENSFNNLISAFAEYDIICCVSFEEDGMMNITESLKDDDLLLCAVEDIYSDQIFQTNPLKITAGRTYEDFLHISIYFYGSESTYCGLDYCEEGVGKLTDGYEERIDEHWYWYSYPKI